MRVHHADRDLNDPLLRAVLSQRTEGGRRRHIDESDCADKQQPSPSEKQMSPQPSTSREISRTLDVKPHPVMSPQGFSKTLYRKGDKVILKDESGLNTGNSTRNHYTIDTLVPRTAPYRRYRYHVVSDTGESVSKCANEDELEYYTEDNANRDNDPQIQARKQSDEPQNRGSAEISDGSDNGHVRPLDALSATDHVLRTPSEDQSRISRRKPDGEESDTDTDEERKSRHCGCESR